MIIVHDENKIITKIIGCNNDEINSVVEQLNIEHYHICENTNACVGMSIDFMLDNGCRKSDKQLLEENLLLLSEDEILDGETIRKLTIQEQVDRGLLILEDNQEIRGDVIVTLSDDEMRSKFPERYPDLMEQKMMTPEESLRQEMSDKRREISQLKDQYIDADIDNNEDLKQLLREQIQDKKSELQVLQGNLQEN